MSGYVKVTKAGRVLEVHPDSLKMHLGLGWVQVPDDGKVARYSEEDLQARVEEAVKKALEAAGVGAHGEDGKDLQDPPPSPPPSASLEGADEAPDEARGETPAQSKKGKGK
jgi:hypothetical protein